MKKLYSLLLIILVSFSSYSQTSPTNTTVTAFVSNVTLTGFTLQFDTPVVGLTVDDIDIFHCAVILSAVPGASTRSAQVRSIDNRTYSITTSPLTNSTTYEVGLTKANYSLSAPISFTTDSANMVLVNASVSNATADGFKMSFDKTVYGFGFSDITINNGASISSITTTDSQNFNVATTALTHGSTYSLSLKKSGYSFYGNTNFFLKTPTPTPVIGTVTNITVNGFSLVFDRAVVGLTASDVTLTGGATVVSLTAVGSDSKKYTIVTSALTAGAAYNVAVAKTGHTIAGALSFTAIPETVIASITNTSTTGFTLSFDKAVEGLTASNLTINNGGTVSGITPSAGNTVYTVTTNTLATGTPYKLTLTKANYAFNNPIAFTVIAVPSTAKALTAFSFAGLSTAVVGVVNENTKTVALTVPSGTNVTALVATFAHTGTSLKVGGAFQSSGNTPNDFTAPVTYTVTAEDGTTQNYVVTVSIQTSSSKALTAFSFAGLSPAVNGVIDETAKTVALSVPSGTNVTALVATFTHTGSSLKIGSTVQTSGTTANNFTSAVTYTVTAEDGTTQNYVVTVTILPNTAKALTAFSFAGLSPAVNGVINETAKTVAVSVPNGTNVTALVATFTHTGVSLKIGSTVQTSGTTANNFTSAVTYIVTAEDGTTQNYVVTVTILPNTAKALTAFSFAGLSPAVNGVIDETAKTVALSVPSGTNVTALVATFTHTGASLKIGSTVQTSGTTANNFTSPVTYTVTAEDGTTQNYVVTVTILPNTAKALTAFSFAGLSPAVNGVINETAKTVALSVPSGTNVTALVATFTHTGASLKIGSTVQTSGTTANNFTSPVTYTVTAEDATTQNYVVTVTILPNTAKALTAFSFAGLSPAVTGVIDETAKTVALSVPSGTNVTALVATFTHTGSSLKIGSTVQTSGTTANNFTSPVTYTVTAEDATTQNYVVTVTILPNTAKALTAFSFAGLSPAVNGVINETAKTVALSVPSGTNVTALVATFTHTGASLKIGSTVQTSGTTANNFTSPVTYTVTAEDGTTQNYVVTVTILPNTAKALTAFSFAGLSPAVNGVIDETAKTVALSVPSGTNVTALVATFTHTGASVKVGSTVQTSGTTANNFTSPVTYIVTAEDATTQNYVVTVTILPNTAKALTAFSFAGLSPAVNGVIDETAKTVALSVPSGTNVTALVATFTHTGVSVKIGSIVQTSGTTANNFTSPVTYTVTAEDATTQNYVVTVTILPNTAKALTAFSFAGLSPAVNGVIDETAKTVALSVPSGTNVTALVATFTHTGASLKIGSTVQTSGTTANNFTSPVTYTVTAEDATTQNYVVTVILPTSSSKAITAFSFAGLSPAVNGMINETAKTVALSVPSGTNVTALVATFTHTGASLKIGSTVQTSGTTANNFTSPVTYTVTAEDATTQNYVVTVTILPNTAKALTAFSFAGLSPAVNGVINETAKTVALSVPSGTNVTALVATFTHTGASLKIGSTVQTSGTTANNFTSSVTYTVTAEDATTQNYVVTVTILPSTAKALTAFSFAGLSPAVNGVIDETAKTVAVSVPSGTNVTALVATFTHTGASLKIGSTVQTSGTTANNFTSPVTYTVTAEDGTTQNYVVTVTILSNTAKALTAFSFAGLSPAVNGVIDETAKTVALSVPSGTNVTALVATFTHTGASLKIGSTVQTSGTTANNFTSPVTYTVTAEDGTTQNYVVTVTILSNTAKALTAFSFAGLSPAVNGVINETAKTVALSVPSGTNVTALVATFTHTGASLKIGSTVQTSGTTANNFTSPVTYTVTAEDGTTQNYVVTVTVLSSSAKVLTAFSFAGLNPVVTGVINQTAKTVALSVPSGTNVTALVATFTHTGASVKIGSTVQTSGTTANNFTSPVTYTVTAEDATTQNYVVTVTILPSTAKVLTAFSFAGLSPAVTGVINEAAKTVELTVPSGTNVTALVATFTHTGASLKIGSTGQTSGTTANNFTSPVTYTVTAEDATTQNYVVTVILPTTSSKAITAFSFAGLSPVVTGVINETAKTVVLSVPTGTNVTALLATFTHTGASVKVGSTVQTSGTTANNFTSPVTYTVTAADATTQNYVVTVSTTTGPTHGKLVLGYFAQWSIYARDYNIWQIDGSKLTHIMYAFFGTYYSSSNEGSTKLKSLDTYADFDQNEAAIPWSQVEAGYAGNMGDLKQLKERYPHLKVIISVGGWTKSQDLPAIARSATARTALANDMVKFMQDRPWIDGFDIDWEFPVVGGIDGIEYVNGDESSAQPHNPDDQKTFVYLVKEMRQKFDAAFGAGVKVVAVALGNNVNDVSTQYVGTINKGSYGLSDDMSTYCDFISFFGYDFGGNWNGVTAYNAPLYASNDPADPLTGTAGKKNQSMEVLVNEFLNVVGIPKEKLVMGVPFYGKIFDNVAGNGSNSSYPGRFVAAPNYPAAAAPNWCPYSQAPKGTWHDKNCEGTGAIDFMDLAGERDVAVGHRYIDTNDFTQIRSTAPAGWRRYWDDTAKVPYLYNSTTHQFVSYDDDKSIKEKAKFINMKELGGAMIWELSQDTRPSASPGHSTADPKPNALITALNEGLSTPIITTPAVVSAYICNTASAGTMTTGIAVSGVTQTITATVTTVGTYNISAVANGVTFTGAGTYSGTGAQNVVLTATGTPTATGTHSFALSGTPTCSFDRATSGPAVVSAYACNTASAGTMTSGVAVSGVTQTITATVTTAGTYNISAVANDVTFSGTGTVSTGAQNIVLTAAGTPTAAGTHSFALSGTPTCSFDRATSGPAVVSAYACNTASAGTMTSGVAVSGVTQTITATVTTAGTYNISAVANGVTFSGTGTVSTGAQNIVLTAAGTPTLAGTHAFALSGTPTCSFDRVTVAGALTGIAKLISSADWETLFPHRYGKPDAGVTAGKGDYYSYASFIAAANGMSNMKMISQRRCGTNLMLVKKHDKSTGVTKEVRRDAGFDESTAAIINEEIDYADFVTSTDLNIAKKELAAFLANISHEVTGGWDAAPGGRFAWGLVFNEEPNYANGGNLGYRVDNAQYPPVAGKSYHGRGPMQLSYNYNYGAASEMLYGDKNVLLTNPQYLIDDSTIAFQTAIWFWMTPQHPKPSCHDVTVGNWVPSGIDISKNRSNGFGMTINIINGGVECGANASGAAAQRADRIGFYDRYSQFFSQTYETSTCDCNTMTPYNDEYPAPCDNSTSVVSAYTCNKASAGTMEVGTAVSGVSQTITATVTTAGTYNISASANGVVFAKTGTFTGTGAQDVVLTATGTPVSIGDNTFRLGNTPSCSFTRNTIAAQPKPSTNGTAIVSAYTCNTASAGSIMVNAEVSGVTQTITATVGTKGTYSISTGAVNGITFAATGSFIATGSQNVVLTATGTPAAIGSNNFILNTTPNCSFSRSTTATVAPTITSVTPGSRDGAGTVTLAATASAGVISWYATQTGGTALATGNSFTTPSITATTTYYVDATAAGLTTATRTAVVATVTTTVIGTVPDVSPTVKGWKTTRLSMGGVINGGTYETPLYKARPIDAYFTYAGIDGGGDRNVQIPVDSKVVNVMAQIREIEAAIGKVTMPTFVFYTVDGSSSLSNVRKDLNLTDENTVDKDATTLRDHYFNLVSISKQLQGYKDATHPVPATLIINPDFLGEIQKQCGEWYCPLPTKLLPDPGAVIIPVNDHLKRAMALLGDTTTVLPTFAEDLSGYIKSINWVVAKFAPDVPFAWQINVWAGDEVGHGWIHRAANQNLPEQIGIHVNGGRSPSGYKLEGVIPFVKRMGAYGNGTINELDINPDFVAFDIWERDVFDSSLGGAGVNNGYLYSIKSMDVFTEYVKQVSEALSVTPTPVMLWQIPGGHLQKQTGDVDTRANHGSTQPDYILGNPDVEDNLSNIATYITTPSVPAGTYSLAADRPVGTYLSTTVPNEWKTGHLTKITQAHVFSILWGGGSTTSVAGSNNNTEDKGWLYQRIDALNLSNK